MTREEAKQLYPIIQAFSEGKTIEYYDQFEHKWGVVATPAFGGDVKDYRIKPQPTYRPFKNAEECWNEMQKHQPFGWARKKNENLYVCITRVYGNDVFDDDFDNYTFADGEPFGVKEDK